MRRLSYERITLLQCVSYIRWNQPEIKITTLYILNTLHIVQQGLIGSLTKTIYL